jgi:hypothetical protein
MHPKRVTDLRDRRERRADGYDPLRCGGMSKREEWKNFVLTPRPRRSSMRTREIHAEGVKDISPGYHPGERESIG